MTNDGSIKIIALGMEQSLMALLSSTGAKAANPAKVDSSVFKTSNLNENQMSPDRPEFIVGRIVDQVEGAHVRLKLPETIVNCRL